jgi:predicted amidophosphoribosyltransferase
MNETYNDWPENFPKTTCLVPYAALRHSTDPEIQELYDRAKNHEDREAAAQLIDRLISDEGIEMIKAIASRHPTAIIISVHAVEGKGKNAVPQALADFIGSYGNLEVDNNIVQTNTVSKTGVKSTWYRLAHRAAFEGGVKAGRDYILVDDVISAGGTFSELRNFIEKNGGRVVDTMAMANGAKSLDAHLAVTPGHILELENKYGVESLQQFLQEEDLYGGNHKALTDAEARTILGAKNLDEARDRCAEARQERSIGILPEMVPGTPPNTEEITNSKNSSTLTEPRFEALTNSHVLENPPRESVRANAAEINPKEKFMSDAAEEAVGSVETEESIENRGEPRTPEEVAFLNTLHQRKVITESLDNGKLSCLPGATGYADTSPAVNIANDTRYHGVNLLYLKDFQKRNDFPSAEYITRDQIDRARAETGDQIFIRKDQKPVTVSFGVKNEGTGEWEQKNVLLYNIAQTTKPWALEKWAEKHARERQRDKENFLKQQYGEQYKPYEPRQKGPGPEIVCSSTEPEKYLGQYLAAVSMGGKFKVSPEQAKDFAVNMKAALFPPKQAELSPEQAAAPVKLDPFKLSKICQAAGAECKDVMREIGRQQREQAPVQQQRQEQKISRGRSR